MNKIRKQAAGVFALAALATTFAPLATASASPDLDCIKKAVAAEINHVVNGGPVPLPCG
jgi:hypothetical protein